MKALASQTEIEKLIAKAAVSVYIQDGGLKQDMRSISGIYLHRRTAERPVSFIQPKSGLCYR